MATVSHYQLRVRGPGERRIYPLFSRGVSIGYDPAVDLFLNDPTIAGRHALIEDVSGQFKLTSLDPDFATVLNSDPLIAKVSFDLRTGDSFQIGAYTLIFEELAHYSLGDTWAADDPQRTSSETRLSPYTGEVPPGVSRYSVKLLPYLPQIYQMDRAIPAEWDKSTELADVTPKTFLARFLALFESVLLPLSWLVENFDFYLDPQTTPPEFFPWLESWYGLPLVANLSIEQQRQLLRHAHELYNLKGSHSALVRVIQLCTNCKPLIEDQTTPGATFRVDLELPANAASAHAQIQKQVETLIVAFKPIHTSYELTVRVKTA